MAVSDENLYFCGFYSYLDVVMQMTPEERGILFTACLMYGSQGTYPELTEREALVFAMMKSDIDRTNAKRERKRQQTRKSAEARWGTRTTDANACERIPYDANASSGMQTHPDECECIQGKEGKGKERKGKEVNGKGMEGESSPPDGGTRTDQEQKHKYGQYGRVRLTDVEYRKLSFDLGETELKRCIDYVDESAQMTDNKNKWKDWNLVLRKCHKEGWGLKQDQTDSSKKDKVVTDDDIFPEVAYYHDRDGVQHCIRRKKP